MYSLHMLSVMQSVVHVMLCVYMCQYRNPSNISEYNLVQKVFKSLSVSNKSFSSLSAYIINCRCGRTDSSPTNNQRIEVQSQQMKHPILL